MRKVKFVFKSLIDSLKFYFFKLLFFFQKKKKCDVWLISERGIDARDNGYWFYKYMVEFHPEIQVKYVISKDSSDRKKINTKDIVDYRSKEHYYYFMFSKYLISAEIMGFSPNEQLFYRLNKYGLLKIKGKTVFLQHGITKDFNPYMLPNNSKLDLFICGAVPEYKYMIEKYGYTEKNAALTGFSRFDKLNNQSENIILVMPTWRKWLKYNDNLFETEFYDSYNKLLNDIEIISALANNNYKIIFYPHIVLQKFLNNFKVTSDNVILASFEEYDVQDLLKKASILITDYSSVAFDLAYMKKKTIYYQFDVEKYRKEQYQDGYYSYEKDGFGPICYDFCSLKKVVIDYLSDSKCLDEYNNRINDFFDKIDKNNCERIFEQIKKL